MLPLLWLLICGGAGAMLLLAPSAKSPPPAKLSAEPRYVTKSIEDIREGDLVLSRDEHGTDMGLRPVTHVFKRTTDHLRILTFVSADGAEQTLETKSPVS